ncbi:MAG: phosphoribosylglycinamide formyltransferase [Actinomycetota bacterium]|nr:phosphoribosylglycinamide formyltransferase [Actinomycetota bacterium]
MSKMVRLAVLASGSGTNLQAIIDSCQRGEIPAEVALVLSNVKEAYALKRAERHGIKALFIDRLAFETRFDYDAELVKILREHEIDLVVLAGYMLLAGLNLAQAFEGKMMNIHPSLLPAFPGTHGVRDALEYGVKVSGVTVHFVDEGLDSGPIILQEAVYVEEDDDEESLMSRIHQAEYRIYPKAIGLFAKGCLEVGGRRVRILKKGEA